MQRTARAHRGSAPHIRDVAARAGVSVATVSRVLTGSSPVTPAKRQQVLDAVDALGYRPSSLGRGLSLGRTGVLGVVAPFFTHAATTARLRGITDRGASEDYDLMIFNVESLRQREDALLKFARRDRLDGLIVISLPLSDEEVAGLRAQGLPTVLVDGRHPALRGISIDDVAGGALAAEHLLRRGHTRIAFVGDAPVSPLGFTSSERRYEGFTRALADAGVEVDRALVCRGAQGRAEARDAVGRLLDAEAPTAVFAASDMQAIGALEAARLAGVDVPRELAVIGFDDTETAEIVGLTTVRQPLADSGAEGMRLLLEELAGDEPGDDVLQPLLVVERDTT